MLPIKWEYAFRSLGADPLLNREMFNVMGQDGWELVVIVPSPTTLWNAVAYLKRPYVEPPLPPLRVVPKDGA